MVECKDSRCPIHGELKVRGKKFEGTVLSSKMEKTVKVEWERTTKVKKFERYKRKRSRITAHKPECMKLLPGDRVIVSECRPLSKTKRFVVLQKVEK
jgi:small subunit ribosomal protein S17